MSEMGGGGGGGGVGGMVCGHAPQKCLIHYPSLRSILLGCGSVVESNSSLQQHPVKT